MYVNGEGVTRDPIEALKWLSLGGINQADARTAAQALERDMTEDQKQEAARRVQEFLELRQQPQRRK